MVAKLSAAAAVLKMGFEISAGRLPAGGTKLRAKCFTFLARKIALPADAQFGETNGSTTCQCGVSRHSA